MSTDIKHWRTAFDNLGEDLTTQVMSSSHRPHPLTHTGDLPGCCEPMRCDPWARGRQQARMSRSMSVGKGGGCRGRKEGVALAKTPEGAEHTVFQKQGLHGSGSSADYVLGKGGAAGNKARKAGQQVAEGSLARGHLLPLPTAPATGAGRGRHAPALCPPATRPVWELPLPQHRGALLLITQRRPPYACQAVGFYPEGLCFLRTSGCPRFDMFQRQCLRRLDWPRRPAGGEGSRRH